MQYLMKALTPSPDGSEVGCTTFCSSKKAVLTEVESQLEHLQLGESVTVSRVFRGVGGG